jgi:hypothetical protein
MAYTGVLSPKRPSDGHTASHIDNNASERRQTPTSKRRGLTSNPTETADDDDLNAWRGMRLSLISADFQARRQAYLRAQSLPYGGYGALCKRYRNGQPANSEWYPGNGEHLFSRHSAGGAS